MTFTEDFLAETVADRRRPSTPTASRRSPTGIAAVRERERAAVHPRRRRLGRPRQPRGQRLPQDLRHRGLRPDRQRLRADRPHQRRGLGHHLRRVARGLAARRRRRACWCSRSAAATPRRTSRPTSCAALELAKERRRLDLRHRRPRRRLHRRSSPTPAWSSRRCTPTTSPRTPRACAPWSGTCWSPTPRSPAPRPSGSPSMMSRRDRPRAGSASSAAPASSAATSCDRLLADADDRAGHASTTTSPRAGDWHLDARRATTPG